MFEDIVLDRSFTKSMKIAKKSVFRQLEDDDFCHMMSDAQWGKITKQRFELMVIIFSMIKTILNENQNLKKKYDARIGSLIYNVLSTISDNKYLKERIDLESEAFNYCLLDRIELYTIEIKRLMKVNYVEESACAPLYYFLFDPGNIWTSDDGYSEIHELTISDVLENVRDPKFLDAIECLNTIKEIYACLLTELT